MRVVLGRWVVVYGLDGFVKFGVVREIGGRMDGLDVCMYVMYVMSLGMMIERYDLVRLLSRTLCMWIVCSFNTIIGNSCNVFHLKWLWLICLGVSNFDGKLALGPLRH